MYNLMQGPYSSLVNKKNFIKVQICLFAHRLICRGMSQNHRERCVEIK